MADNRKKEPTPPPLLFMPAGGGLTLTPPDQPNILMPVIQSEPSLFGPEDEGLGEADSFVGQSPPHPGPGAPLMAPSSTSNLFQSPAMTTASDPFSQINQGTQVRPPVSFPPGPSTPQKPPAVQNVTPMAPTSQVPISGAPMASVPPMPNATGLAGLYRKHGSSRYAQMPAGTYANTGGMSPATLMANPPAPTPFSPNFSEAATLDSIPPPPNTASPLPPQPSLGQMSGMGYVQDATGIYVPIMYHWCVCKNIEGREIWYPLPMSDSLALEEGLKLVNTQGQENLIVSIEGGRYDVNVVERRRYAVYWEEDPKIVRRCSWFFKREGDNRYIPYEEHFCGRLEEEYRIAVTSGVWHKPLQFDSGETIVMHNSNVMVHYQPSSQPDEWGNVQVSPVTPAQGDQMRPRVVKRGVSDFESIDEGEAKQVDHLVFVVHGIGSVCDLRFRSIIECVDDFRSISQNLLRSHFTKYVDSNRMGRVEFLPIQWHKALHGDATGIDKRLKAITLPSTTKLRNFVNDTLMDVLFYTSPTYCQCIADTVGNEINRLYNLFVSRNPQFKGSCSVAGHSLGSCILFDLLQHQGDQCKEMSTSEQVNGQPEPDITPVNEPEAVMDAPDDEAVEEETVMDLDVLLSKVGLQDKKTLFEQEQIDMESLIMCSDSDLKDLGLPMGPRKKLQGILKEELSKKDAKKLEQERKAKNEADKKLRQKLAEEFAAKQQEQKQQSLQNGEMSVHTSPSLTINYLVGVGGTGQPSIKYTQLSFTPVCCFSLGSPVGLFLSARGVEAIGEDFRLPTCQKYFNIFHPFDPVAYRLEPLINPSTSTLKPVLMPHHKGRKRLHLELKESLARMGTDIKHKIIESVKSTWNSINNFARAHQTDGVSLEDQVESEMSNISKQLEDEERSETGSIASVDDVYIGQLNEGRRVDYVLQERPIESFNDYMFSLTSHGCYWNSEDTVLLVLKEIYALYGISPTIPGADSQSSQRPQVGPPPKMGLAASPYGFQSTSPPQMSSPGDNFQQHSGTNMRSPQGPPQMYSMSSMSPPSGPPQMAVSPNMPPPSGPPQMAVSPNFPAMSGPPPFSMGQPAQMQLGTSAGPPPMAGFMKKS